MSTWIKSIDNKKQEHIQDYEHKIDGATSKMQEVIGAVTKKVDGEVEKVEEIAGLVTKQIDGVTGQVSTIGNSIVQDTQIARQVMMNGIHRVESVISSMSTTPIATELGGKVFGVQFGVSTAVKFSPTGCADMAKLIKDIFKIIDILNLGLDILEPGGVGPIHDAVATLGKFKVPCFNIQAAVKATTDAQVPFASLPSIPDLPTPT